MGEGGGEVAGGTDEFIRSVVAIFETHVHSVNKNTWHTHIVNASLVRPYASAIGIPHHKQSHRLSLSSEFATVSLRPSLCCSLESDCALSVDVLLRARARQ